jgi:hypothetical protein
MGFSLERNRPPPRLQVFPWLPACAHRGRGVRRFRAAQKRLTRLFHAGLLERFRPVTRRGSYPWIYQLGPEGHKLLRNAGLIRPSQRYERRDVYDYTYVLDDLHLNSWVLAYRRAIGDALIEWERETAIEPPPAARRTQLRLDDNWSVEGLKAQRPRAVVPDAVLEIARPNSNGKRVFLIEYDRTTRVDKNYEKFRRYDAFLTSWWRHTGFSGAPWVLFVCQHETHRDQFLAAADRDITGLSRGRRRSVARRRGRPPRHAGAARGPDRTRRARGARGRARRRPAGDVSRHAGARSALDRSRRALRARPCPLSGAAGLAGRPTAADGTPQATSAAPRLTPLTCY